MIVALRGWPVILCPSSEQKVHRFYLDMGQWWLCRWCEAVVEAGQIQQMFGSWQWVVARATWTEQTRSN